MKRESFSKKENSKFKAKATGTFRSNKSTPLKPHTAPKKDNNSSVKEDEFIRLNKWLATSGVCSRRKADELIATGAVIVNGLTVTELGTKIARTDFITVNGDPIKELHHDIYILLNKPKNVITTTNDEFDRKTVLDIVKKQDRVFPVGRLDRNTTGILLITNDGELAFRLTHPTYSVERTYSVKLDKALKAVDAQKIANGIELEDGLTQPCIIEINPTDGTKLLISITEGKNREIRRIFEALHYEVKQLDRKVFAGLTTKGLGRGEYRHLTNKEVLNLKRQLKMN